MINSKLYPSSLHRSDSVYYPGYYQPSEVYPYYDNNNTNSITRYYYDCTNKSKKKIQSRGFDNDDNNDESTLGVILGAIMCFVLFCIIVFSISYPLTMYKESPSTPMQFSEDKWWCYHCTNPSLCGAKCW